MKRHAYDRYDTPFVALDALLQNFPEIHGTRLLEPCAGDGRIARYLMAEKRFKEVRCNDLDPHTPAELHLDACAPELYEPQPCWTITNPPFRGAARIAKTAIEKSKQGVALLLRCTFLEPCLDRLWLVDHPPTQILSMPRLSFIGNGKADWAPAWWFVWLKGGQGSIRVAPRWEDSLLQETLFSHAVPQGPRLQKKSQLKFPFGAKTRALLSEINAESLFFSKKISKNWTTVQWLEQTTLYQRF